MERFERRIALVTGASAGFGEAISKRLVKYGMTVAGCDRNIAGLKALEASLQKEKGTFFPIQCDVSMEDQILTMFENIKDKFGGVDVCINNAGLSHDAPLLTGQTADWRNMLEVNVLGLCICTREAVKSMKERKVDDGHIILLCSMSGHRVLNDPPLHMYAASKFAVRAITEGIRNELAQMKSHIRVTAISPGSAETGFFQHMYSDKPEIAEQMLSSMQALTTEDIVDSIIYAISTPTRVQVHDILIRPTESQD